jgi:hypothetical protein
VTPAWEPVAGHRVAAVDGRGRIVLRDTDNGRMLWRAGRPAARVAQLAWSPDGRRLLAVTPTAVLILDARGHTRRALRMPVGTRAGTVAWLPGGRRFALLRAGATGSELLLVHATPVTRPATRPPSRLLALPGRLADPVVSPDGHHLLVAAPDAGQWLLVRTAGGGRLTALDRVGRQFDPGGRGAAALPRPVAWSR